MLLNRERAHSYMRRHALDALVATSPLNVTYFTDYYCWIDPLFKEYMMRPGASSSLGLNYGFVPLVGEAALIVSPLWVINTTGTWVPRVRSYGVGDLDFSATPEALARESARVREIVREAKQHATATQALVAQVREQGLEDARIGVELEGVTAAAREELFAALPRARLLDCSNLIRLVRMVKTAEEIERLETSTRLNYRAAMASLSTAGEGVRLGELAQRYLEAISAEGALLDHFIAAPRGLGIVQGSDHELRRGDVMYVDFGCVWRRYYSDNGTTLAVGTLTTEMQARYEALRNALARAVAQVRPGVLASTLRETMIEALREMGISGSNAHGHGIGLEVRDYPIIVGDTGLRIRDDCVDEPADVPLEADMVICLELPLFLFGVGSMHIEQTFAVTQSGCRRLDSQEETAPVVVG